MGFSPQALIAYLCELCNLDEHDVLRDLDYEKTGVCDRLQTVFDRLAFRSLGKQKGGARCPCGVEVSTLCAIYSATHKKVGWVGTICVQRARGGRLQGCANRGCPNAVRRRATPLDILSIPADAARQIAATNPAGAQSDSFAASPQECAACAAPSAQAVLRDHAGVVEAARAAGVRVTDAQMAVAIQKSLCRSGSVSGVVDELAARFPPRPVGAGRSGDSQSGDSLSDAEIGEAPCGIAECGQPALRRTEKLLALCSAVGYPDDLVGMRCLRHTRSTFAFLAADRAKWL